MEKPSSWADEVPVYLVLSDGNEELVIDLGEREWATTYADWMRRPGRWVLVDKATDAPLLLVLVAEGEQPYYARRNVSNTAAEGVWLSAYGIGKKRLDGHVDRLWYVYPGIVLGGDDVEEFLDGLLKDGVHV